MYRLLEGWVPSWVYFRSSNYTWITDASILEGTTCGSIGKLAIRENRILQIVLNTKLERCQVSDQIIYNTKCYQLAAVNPV
jgi:hypothetical protein